ncbi:MAG: NADPH-dependent F420 reductase [Alphaproteobacteria bacterium]
MTSAPKTIAILGGTGDLGTGLARRWAKAGHKVVIGSRTAEKAEAAAADLKDFGVRGLENKAAAEAAEIVAITVPYANQVATLEAVKDALAGKILIDATVPLMPPKVGTVQLPEGGSAAVAAQKMLGDGVTVVSAFQNVAAAKLQSDVDLECDVLVAGDKVAARQVVIDLVEDAGMRGWHVGPLANSAAAEALTSLIIQINRRYGIDGAGIRITGTPTKDGRHTG